MNKARRILLYGFGPYRQFHQNITATIIKTLPRQPGLQKVVFPVRFHRRQFVDAIERFQPEIVIGLGQSSRRRIEVELQAANCRRARPAGPVKNISARGPARLNTTLKLKLGQQGRKSNNAGDYVCNFSMYVILDHIRRKALDIVFGFIHVPHGHDENKALRLVQKILGDCRHAATRKSSGLAAIRVSSSAG
jgi:pyroglutamyl-peptidase